MILIESLDDGRGTHATAAAHCLQTEAPAVNVERVDQQHQASTARAEQVVEALATGKYANVVNPDVLKK